MEQVDNDVALLRARVATLRSKEATLDRARADFDRARTALQPRRDRPGGIRPAPRGRAGGRGRWSTRPSKRSTRRGSPSACRRAPRRESCPTSPPTSTRPSPASARRWPRWSRAWRRSAFPWPRVDQTPKQALAEFISRDKEGNIDRILERIVPEAPAVRQAEAKLLQAQRDLAQAELNLRYCDVVERDRRRGDPPQRQPGQQRRRSGRPDGRPLAHRDLDRRQLQGDAARRPADRPAGRGARSTCTASRQRVRGPHHRLHDGNRPDPGPPARRRTPRATS